METDVLDVGGPQRKRLAHVDFRLYFLDEVSRADISRRFEVPPAVAVRDLSRYRTLAPNNIRSDRSPDTYRTTDDFSHLFEHSLDLSLSALSRGLGDGLGGVASGLVPCGYPVQINRHALKVMAATKRTIAGRRVLAVSYLSSSNGETEREIVPLALADNRLRRHVRAFDRRASSFCNFILTRPRGVRVLSGDQLREESVDHDVQWSREVEMEIVPHPDFPHQELAELAGCIQTMERREPLAAGTRVSLWLRNRTVQKSAVSAPVTPGSLSEETSRG